MLSLVDQESKIKRKFDYMQIGIVDDRSSD
jgi:hypothetical protein